MDDSTSLEEKKKVTIDTRERRIASLDERTYSHSSTSNTPFRDAPEATHSEESSNSIRGPVQAFTHSCTEGRED